MRAHLKVFTALTFLRINSPDIRWYQWIYPLGITTIFLLLYMWLAPADRPNLFGNGSITVRANGLLNMLIGFYIAALAAIASFPSSSLNQPMKGRTPVLKVRRGGEPYSEPLTRRRFMSILFGYCAFVSIALYLAGVFTELALPALARLSLPEPVWVTGKAAWLASYSFFSASLLVTTLLGLHYLIDRMHRD